MNSALRFDTHSDEETRETGRRLSHMLPASGVVLLSGNLGAGKTTLAKGIVEGRGAADADEVLSPTFTLIHEYGDPVAVYHIDLYRLENADEARALGIEDLFDSKALVLVEWGERFRELFPAEAVEIRMRQTSEMGRSIEVSGLLH